jgi:hypothetical protein
MWWCTPGAGWWLGLLSAAIGISSWIAMFRKRKTHVAWWEAAEQFQNAKGAIEELDRLLESVRKEDGRLDEALN